MNAERLGKLLNRKVPGMISPAPKPKRKGRRQGSGKRGAPGGIDRASASLQREEDELPEVECSRGLAADARPINLGQLKPPLEALRQQERIVELTNKVSLQQRQIKALETHINELLLPQHVAQAKLAEGRLLLEEENRRLRKRVCELAEQVTSHGEFQKGSVGEKEKLLLGMPEEVVKETSAAIGPAKVKQVELSKLSRTEMALKACQDRAKMDRKEAKNKIDFLSQELAQTQELALQRRGMVQSLTSNCKTLSDALESMVTEEEGSTHSKRTEDNRFRQALIQEVQQKKAIKHSLDAAQAVVRKQREALESLQGEVERLAFALSQEQQLSDSEEDSAESTEQTDLEKKVATPDTIKSASDRPETATTVSTQGKRRSTILGTYFMHKSRADILGIESLPDGSHLDTRSGFKTALDTVDRDLKEKHSRSGGLKNTTLKLRNMLELCNSFSMQRRKVNAEFGLCEAIAHQGPKSLLCEHLLLLLPRTRMQNIMGELWTVTKRDEHMIELKTKPRIIEYMFEHKEPVHVEEFRAEEEEFDECLTLLFAKSKEALLLPVYSAEHENVCGVILATHSHSSFSDLDESLLLLLATSVQENLNLIRRERELRQETALLGEIKQLDAINIDLTYQPPTVLAQRIEEAVSRLLMSAKAVMFFVDFRGGAIRVWTTKSSHEEAAEENGIKWINLTKGTSICAQVVHSGVPLLTLDAYNHPAFNGNVDIGKQLQHGQPMICVPIKSLTDSFFARWRERQKYAVAHDSMAVIQLVFEEFSGSNAYVFSFLQHKFTVLDRYCSRIAAMVDCMWQYLYASQPRDFHKVS